MTIPTEPGDNDFVQGDVSDEIVRAVALETQIRSQGRIDINLGRL